ncbi:MAG TPA: glycosyltransferase 87 family protein [Acidimicrobiales bacterium]|jgi:alpha-1,2-mannosyltransferase
MPVLWAIGAVSAGAVVFYAFLFAYARHEVDLDVYLMGGANLFGGHLYTVQDANTHLPFTYPPFAAFLFVPLSAIPEQAAELLVGAVNVVALAALVGVSLRALRPAWDRTRLLVWTLILMGPALAMDPVRLTFSFGQVNIILAALILADLTGVVKVGSKTIPTGVLTGLTAAVKLIPLIFVPYLFLIGRIRAMWIALATFVACGLGLALLAPHTSWMYWTKYVSDTNRVGTSAFISNQSLRAVIIRLHHANIPNSVFYVAALGFGLAGLGLALWAHRASSPLLGILVCATTGMVVSPITWAHHMVWVIPILLWLVLADDRPVGGWIWAAAAALVLWKAPIWMVPYNHGRELGETAWQLLLGNSFFWAMMVFLIGVAAMLAFRHPRGSNRIAGPTLEGRTDVRHRETDPEPVSALPGGG